VTATMPVWWQRRREPTPEERNQALRAQAADRAIKRIDILAEDLEQVVSELHSIARRLTSVEE
jgi:3-oxoacyl-[acyl-carrier-protein] synthase III